MMKPKLLQTLTDTTLWTGYRRVGKIVASMAHVERLSAGSNIPVINAEYDISGSINFAANRQVPGNDMDDIYRF